MSLSQQSGVSLIEVLLALLIFSAVFLGLFEVQLTALHRTQSAYRYSIAAQQVASWFSRLQINTSAEAHHRAFDIWQKNNQRLLPQGWGSAHKIVWRGGKIKF